MHLLMLDLKHSLLSDLIGCRVRVHIQLGDDAEYGPQIAVHGILEVCDVENFRVLTTDQYDPGTSFSYFTVYDVLAIVDRRASKEGPFKGGASAVIYIGGVPSTPFEEMDDAVFCSGELDMLIPNIIA